MRKLKPGYARPVIVHRAILGSVERMFAILCEHTGGKWPFWLSPRQVQVVPINDNNIEFAQKEGFCAELHTGNAKMGKKVREASLLQFNYIAVCGNDEEADGLVDVRQRDGKRLGKFTVNKFVDFLKQKEPQLSKAESKLLKESFFNKEVEHIDHEKMNCLLCEQSYLEGDGCQVGEADWKLYKNLCCQSIDSKKFAHFARWKKSMDKLAAKKDKKELEKCCE